MLWTPCPSSVQFEYVVRDALLIFLTHWHLIGLFDCFLIVKLLKKIFDGLNLLFCYRSNTENAQPSTHFVIETKPLHGPHIISKDTSDQAGDTVLLEMVDWSIDNDNISTIFQLM